jgi:peroxiredoxin
LQTIQNEFKDKGVAVVMISLDEEHYKVPLFLKKNPASAMILLSDGQVQGRYGVQGIPHNLVLDAKGMIRYRVRAGKDVEDAFRRVIESLLKEGEKVASSAQATEKK